MLEQTTQNNKSKLLDQLEELLISAILPFVREIKIQMKLTESDERVIARNLIGKIGARIMFGASEGIDNVLLGKK